MRINNILIVDDDKVDSEFLSMVIKEINPSTDVREAESKQALFENLAEKIPDLIFIDSFIKNDSGHTGIMEIKANPKFAGIPVIMYTGSNDMRSITKAFEAGAASYIVKPGSLTEIEKIMLHVLNIDWTNETGHPKQYYSGQFYHFKEG